MHHSLVVVVVAVVVVVFSTIITIAIIIIIIIVIIFFMIILFVSSEPILRLIEELVREVVVVAQLEGVDIDLQEAITTTVTTMTTMNYQMSSTAQDLKKRKISEIEFLNGEVNNNNNNNISNY